MKQINKIFHEIFLIELKDLDDDIKALIEQSKYKYTHDEISSYVCMENLAVLQNELFGVEGYIEEIKKIDPGSYDSIDNMINALREILINRIEEKGIVHSIILLVE
ncbi:MAG: hypothetical protein JXB50_15435, partial [Spirochaetes bacterium]|nr:hypothetical protein [Spirochaetota bacterium]